jgi:hypothetical protein
LPVKSIDRFVRDSGVRPISKKVCFRRGLTFAKSR